MYTHTHTRLCKCDFSHAYVKNQFENTFTNENHIQLMIVYRLKVKNVFYKKKVPKNIILQCTFVNVTFSTQLMLIFFFIYLLVTTLIRIRRVIFERIIDVEYEVNCKRRNSFIMY